MKSILESMMARPRVFLPENVTEYVALQLAKQLEDADSVLRYVTLLDRYGLHLILEAFTRSKEHHQNDTPAKAFSEALRRLAGKETNNDL